MLTAWREITKWDYPVWHDLLDMIPSPCKLPIANISKGGWIMMDTYNAARKLLRFLIEYINGISKKEGMISNQIKIF